MDTSFPPTFHWQEYIATLNCRGGWEIQSSCMKRKRFNDSQALPQVNFYFKIPQVLQLTGHTKIVWCLASFDISGTYNYFLALTEISVFDSYKSTQQKVKKFFEE